MSSSLTCSRRTASLVFSMVLAIMPAMTANAQPESGGPPIHPIGRTAPRLFETTITADIFTEKREITENDPLLANQSELVVPVLIKGAFSHAYPDSIVVAGVTRSPGPLLGSLSWQCFRTRVSPAPTRCVRTAAR